VTRTHVIIATYVENSESMAGSLGKNFDFSVTFHSSHPRPAYSAAKFYLAFITENRR
jgi:hypothetical protein